MATPSEMSLEEYSEMFFCLCKGAGNSVKTFTPMEGTQFKVSKLKQVLSLHGISAGSKTKTELLDRMAGMHLYNPKTQPASGSLHEGGSQVASRAPHLGIIAEDLHGLGWAWPSPSLNSALDSTESWPPEAPLHSPHSAQPQPQSAAPPQPLHLATAATLGSPTLNAVPVERGRTQLLNLPTQSSPRNVEIEGGVEKIWSQPALERSHPFPKGWQLESQGESGGLGDDPPGAAGGSAGSEGQEAAAGSTRQIVEGDGGQAAKRRRLPGQEVLYAVTMEAHKRQTAETTTDQAGKHRAPPSTKAPPTAAKTCVDQRPPSLVLRAGAVAADSCADAPSCAQEAPGQAAMALENPCAPWLNEGIGHLKAQGYSVSTASSGKDDEPLVNRKVAFALLSDLEMEFRGKVLKVGAGICVGRVVEELGSGHQEDVCEPGCLHAHCYFFVRTEAAISGGRGCRAVDLKVDMHPRLRVFRFEDCFAIPESQLEDVWMLLEAFKP